MRRDSQSIVADLDARMAEVKGFAAALVADGKIDGSLNQELPLCACSTFKVAAAAAVMTLVQEGRLDLDVPATELQPNLAFSAPEFGRTVTLRQLLSHTSGLDDTNQIEVSPRSVLGRLPFVIAPGRAFRYSNVAFDIAIEVAAAIDGKSFTDFVQSRVLAPLGMTSTRASPEFPHSAPETTVRDLAQLALEMLGGGRILTQASIDEMREVHADSYTAAPNRFYGLGLSLERWNAYPNLSAHGGGLGRYGSAFVLDSTANIGAVFLFSDPAGYAASPHALLDELRGKTLSPVPKRDLAVDWRDYIGMYSNGAVLRETPNGPLLEWKGRSTGLRAHDERVLTGEGRISVGLLPGEPTAISVNDFILIGARPGVRTESE